MINDLFVEGIPFIQGKYEQGRNEYSAIVSFENKEAKIKACVIHDDSIVVKTKTDCFKVSVDGYFYVPLIVGINTLTVEYNDGCENDTSTISIIRMKSKDTVYKDLYRPQFHHTPQMFLSNDPNGLVYNGETGEYHLFYQYASKLISNSETKVWAHAVSKDLAKWEEKPIAVFMDDLGEAYSGSAVIDKNNTSGLFNDSVPPEARMIIIYTSYTGYFGDKSNGSQSQSLAYSLDNGDTWIKYEGNPVISNPGEYYDVGFRDPKVLWFSDSSMKNGGTWVMVVGGGVGRLFISDNLIDWKFQNTICDEKGMDIVVECPDIFKITSDEGESKWVYIGSLYNDGNSRIVYSVGQLVYNDKGLNFSVEKSCLNQSVNGNCAVYALQTFFGAPNNRIFAISWIRDWASFYDPENNNVKDWYGTHTLTTEFHLKKNGSDYVLYETPVEELNSLRKAEPAYVIAEETLVSNNCENILSAISGKIISKMYEIVALINPGDASSFGFELCKDEKFKTSVYYDDKTKTINLDRTNSGIALSEGGALISVDTKKDSNGNILMHIYVDASIIDVFGSNGTKAINTQIYPGKDSNGMEFFVKGGTCKIQKLIIYEMSSMYDL